VLSTTRSRAFHHFDLGGGLTVEDEDVLSHVVESVTCRWCGSTTAIETVDERGDGEPAAVEGSFAGTGPGSDAAAVGA